MDASRRSRGHFQRPHFWVWGREASSRCKINLLRLVIGSDGKETRTCRLRSRIHLRAKRARERSCSNISRKRRWAVPPRPRSTQRRRSISAALDSADYNNNKLLGAPPHMPRTTRTLSHQALMSWRSRRLDILSFAPRSSETDLGNLKLR